MKVLHPDEARQLVAAVDVTDPFGARDQALILFCLHTGVRVSELVALDVSHVAANGEPRQAMHLAAAITKGRRERTVPLNATARQAIQAILDFNRRRGFSTSPSAPLFMTRSHGRMTARAVQRLVKNLREKALLDVPATPHTLRHSFASGVLSCNGNLRVVQLLLGHKRINTVEIYTHPTRDDLRRAVARITPREG
jgi:site-specific recombinase XerD